MQIASASAGGADIIIIRTTMDFSGSRVATMTTEEVLVAFRCT